MNNKVKASKYRKIWKKIKLTIILLGAINTNKVTINLIFGIFWVYYHKPFTLVGKKFNIYTLFIYSFCLFVLIEAELLNTFNL